MKSSDGLDCISLSSCRIRFTAGFFRLYLSSAIRSDQPPTATVRLNRIYATPKRIRIRPSTKRTLQIYERKMEGCFPGLDLDLKIFALELTRQFVGRFLTCQLSIGPLWICQESGTDFEIINYRPWIRITACFCSSLALLLLLINIMVGNE